jgi:hypothetical protein
VLAAWRVVVPERLPRRRESGRNIHAGYIGSLQAHLCRSGARPVVSDGLAKVLGGLPCRGRLGGMVLCCSQVRDRIGQHRQADSEIARVSAVGRQAKGSKPPSHEPQPIPWVGASRYPGLRRAGSQVVGIRRLAQRRIPEHPRRNAHNIRYCPCGVRAAARIAGGAALYMRGRRPGLARRVLIRRVPLGSGDPVQS